MSKIQVSSNANGTGVFTVAAPNSSVDRTLTLPDETGTILSSVSNITTQTKAALNASGDAPVYACRAWVNFNGVGTVAIRASGNVSSITDRGTGAYTVNFTTAMQDVNYCFTAASNANSSSGISTLVETATGKTASALLVYGSSQAGAVIDVVSGYVAVFR